MIFLSQSPTKALVQDSIIGAYMFTRYDNYLNKSEKLKKYLDGKDIIKEIYVENKLINLVVR